MAEFAAGSRWEDPVLMTKSDNPAESGILPGGTAEVPGNPEPVPESKGQLPLGPGAGLAC